MLPKDSKKDHLSSSRTTGGLVPNLFDSWQNMPQEWYKIGTGTKGFTFYGILSNADAFDFCILLFNRLHRGDVIDEQL